MLVHRTDMRVFEEEIQDFFSPASLMKLTRNCARCFAKREVHLFMLGQCMSAAGGGAH